MSDIDMNLLKERVKNPVHFVRFEYPELWYRTYDGWEFPINVDETKNEQGGIPSFRAEEKGITLMRWIRKFMDSVKVDALDAYLAENLEIK
jgi:hypothetical protein